ncbi:unnamed protein product [Chondrus crispus]|uniref:non-specific serine/threonine protein kinase n=1 Tax=Chondrus crispus TaxID=2769 RepID=R7QAD0_CHOCR|nr:unnamed protein product [Chondrus crispus]CDF34425.1 unnamed protein product [Chondrus crispus]|eukprot:XP_005714244.1 unnamed protein product [Chondrus crispus]
MRNGRYFSAKSILKFGIQAIRRIRALHELGYVHSDIKPENFLIGDTDPNCIHLIDFGLSRQFINTTTGEFRSPYQPKYRGTAAYCSLFVNMGYEHARRDDLISLGHTMINILERNQLPWFGTLRDYLRLVRESDSIENRSRPLHKIAAAAQKATSIEELCHRMPMMQRFFEYLYGLNYEDRPEYEYLEGILSNGLASFEADLSNNLIT